MSLSISGLALVGISAVAANPSCKSYSSEADLTLNLYGDDKIEALYIDGLDYLDRLPDPFGRGKPHTIETTVPRIPGTHHTIAVKIRDTGKGGVGFQSTLEIDNVLTHVTGNGLVFDSDETHEGWWATSSEPAANNDGAQWYEYDYLISPLLWGAPGECKGDRTRYVENAAWVWGPGREDCSLEEGGPEAWFVLHYTIPTPDDFYIDLDMALTGDDAVRELYIDGLDQMAKISGAGWSTVETIATSIPRLPGTEHTIAVKVEDTHGGATGFASTVSFDGELQYATGYTDKWLSTLDAPQPQQCTQADWTQSEYLYDARSWGIAYTCDLEADFLGNSFVDNAQWIWGHGSNTCRVDQGSGTTAWFVLHFTADGQCAN